MKKILWIDRQGNKYTKEDINDEYLLNIIKYIKRGGYGYHSFATNEVVKRLIYEARDRSLYSESEAEAELLDITGHRIEIEDFRVKVITDFLACVANVKDLNRFDEGDE